MRRSIEEFRAGHKAKVLGFKWGQRQGPAPNDRGAMDHMIGHKFTIKKTNRNSYNEPGFTVLLIDHTRQDGYAWSLHPWDLSLTPTIILQVLDERFKAINNDDLIQIIRKVRDGLEK